MTSSFRAALLPGQAFVPDPLPRPARTFRRSREEQTALEPGAANALEPPRDPEELLREAYERGREAGRNELPWQDAEQLQSARLALEQAVRALDDERRADLRAQREMTIELALAVARRILEREVAARLDDLEPLLERALPLLAQAGPVVLFLAPRDLETLRSGGAPAIEALAGRALEGVVADEELRAGDARLCAGSAGVDARVSTILSQFRAELRELVNLEEDSG